MTETFYKKSEVTIWMNNFFKRQGETLFAKFQIFGKALMLPIAILPAAGLLLGIRQHAFRSERIERNRVFKSLLVVIRF